jgi:hypothetical protein
VAEDRGERVFAAHKPAPEYKRSHQVDIHLEGEFAAMNSYLGVALAGLALVLLSTGQALAGVPISVPEPSSLAVLAAAVGGVAWAKFRRRK